MMLKIFKSLAIILLLFTTTALANPRTYDIDIVIFSHITPQTLQSERWPALSSDTISAFSQNTVINNIKPTYQLQREKNILQNTPDYTVLFSGSFQQSWDNIGTSVTIPINSNSLTGNVTVTLGHYFDVYTNLLFTEPTSVLQKMDAQGYFAHWTQSTYTFRFAQHRRMRSRELNYLGNPLMGVLIKMNPVN